MLYGLVIQDLALPVCHLTAVIRVGVASAPQLTSTCMTEPTIHVHSKELYTYTLRSPRNWDVLLPHAVHRLCDGQCCPCVPAQRSQCELSLLHHSLVFPHCRPSARRKPDYEPVGNTDEAQKKFGNVKAISSDMYFGIQAQTDVRVQRAPTGTWRTRKKLSRGGHERTGCLREKGPDQSPAPSPFPQQCWN